MTAAKKWGIWAKCPDLEPYYPPGWAHGDWAGQRTKRARFATKLDAQRAARKMRRDCQGWSFSVRELPR